MHRAATSRRIPSASHVGAADRRRRGGGDGRWRGRPTSVEVAAQASMLGPASTAATGAAHRSPREPQRRARTAAERERGIGLRPQQSPPTSPSAHFGVALPVSTAPNSRAPPGPASTAATGAAQAAGQPCRGAARPRCSQAANNRSAPAPTFHQVPCAVPCKRRVEAPAPCAAAAARAARRSKATRKAVRCVAIRQRPCGRAATHGRPRAACTSPAVLKLTART